MRSDSGGRRARRRFSDEFKDGAVRLVLDEGKTVAHPKDAGEMAGKVRADVTAWRKRALAALATLQAQPQCDKSKVAAIGSRLDIK